MVASVVFDLDGTLIDPAPDLIATLNTVFAREGFMPVPFEEARALIGAGARRLIERGLALQTAAPDPREADRLYADYIAHYADHIAERSRPFPGIEAALDRLGAGGARIGGGPNQVGW